MCTIHQPSVDIFEVQRRSRTPCCLQLTQHVHYIRVQCCPSKHPRKPNCERSSWEGRLFPEVVAFRLPFD